MVVGAQGLTGALALAALVGAASGQPLIAEGGCRDGQPHGAYELKGPAGEVRVVGAFNRGRRIGSFLFWSSTGTRVAQLPFDDDALTGTVALWYLPARKGAEPVHKLEAFYVRGRLAGVKRSWFPDGKPRAEYRYDDGTLVAARAFAASGAPLPDADARALAARDEEADARFYAELTATVRAHPPRCETSPDRTEKS